nr:hypothetical protein [Neorhizobium tomejilense]
MVGKNIVRGAAASFVVLAVVSALPSGATSVPYRESATAFWSSVKLNRVEVFLSKRQDELNGRPGCAWFDNYAVCWGEGDNQVLIDFRIAGDARHASSLGAVTVIDGNAANRSAVSS